MRVVPALAALSFLILLAGCVAPRGREAAAASAHPNPIVINEFTFSPGIIALDPSFGFSLHRGEPGVPPRRRAESVGRGAAFDLAQTIADELTRLGYDVRHVDAGGPPPGGRALLVRGAFRQIYEGHRRQHAHVSVVVEIDSQMPGRAPQRLTVFTLDSRTLPAGRFRPGRHGTSVNYQATRLGAAIAAYVAELARANNWPGAAR
ncbi:MAG TPA: hypothetical protein VFX06_02070 [Stellaceae bacterium]|nr:hypothetical protein [Stellaceae bacterium]